MAGARNLVTTESRGVNAGIGFNDLAVAKSGIRRIVVWYGNYIDALMVHYDGPTEAVKHGGSGGTMADIVLEPGEYITKIEGNEYKTSISRLTFYSNKARKWGPYGRDLGSTFTWDPATMVSSDLAPHMGLLYFQGSWIVTMGSLQATFGNYPSLTTKPLGVRYEVQRPNKDSPQSTSTLSKFARSIMSPIITLAVGVEEIDMYAYEDVLCRLPFFRAALRTGFKETFDKRILMPDEEPEIVAALIEFLYVESYTYTYTPELDTAHTPPCDLSEGSFHLRVYATASKYDCQGLVEAAMASLIHVMRHIDGIDVVQLLKETYLRGCNIPLWEAMAALKHELPAILKRVYLTHRQDMKNIIFECPLLAHDLLELSVSAHPG